MSWYLRELHKVYRPVGNSSERSAPKVLIGITSSRALVDWYPQELFLFKLLSVLGFNLWLEIIILRGWFSSWLQEVTENIYNIFQQASWWKSYNCSVKPGEAARRAYFCMQVGLGLIFCWAVRRFRLSNLNLITWQETAMTQLFYKQGHLCGCVMLFW